MKKIISFSAVALCALLYSCINRCDEDCVNPPMPLWFKVVDNATNENLITKGIYIKDSIKIFYYEGDVKKYSNPTFVGPIGQTDVIQTNMGIILPFGQLNTFYLYLNHNDIDTIQVRYVKSSDGCCSTYPLDSIAINGKYAAVDNEYAFLIKK